tara:strand:- start:405 stop:581 length:177 start_codon:yes stop_codon:yes gene_type:complete
MSQILIDYTKKKVESLIEKIEKKKSEENSNLNNINENQETLLEVNRLIKELIIKIKKS